MAQGRFDEGQDVVGRVGVTGSQPEIGDHPCLRHKRQQGMVRWTPTPTGVVSPCRAFLFPMAGEHRGVHVEGNPLERADLRKKPAIDGFLYRLIACHVEPFEQSHDGLVSRRLRPTKQAGQGAVKAYRLGMGKATCTAPDGDDPLFNQLHGRIASIGPRRRQIPTRGRLPKIHLIEHALQQCHPSPGANLSI